jgi:AcrR family transcriptional regulator
MNERVAFLRRLEPKSSSLGSYQAILEAAAGLFNQFPAEDIALRDILSASGVANQTLYNHFPNGRDDIAIVLQDRYQQVIVHSFNRLAEASDWSECQDAAATSRILAACLAGAAFDYLHQNFGYLASLRRYLLAHGLLSAAIDSAELEQEFQREVQLRQADRISRPDLPRVTRISVRITLEMVAIALDNPQFPLDDLVSSTRVLLRNLLQTAVKEKDAASAGFHLHCAAPSSIAVPPARISGAAKETIFSRILRRNRGSGT